MSICSQRGENESHLEVSAIYNMPFFLDSIERGGTDQVLAKEHELAKLVGYAPLLNNSAYLALIFGLLALSIGERLAKQNPPS